MILDKLRALKLDLRARFGVEAISVFGSYARGEARPGSDLDLLIDFAPESRPTLFSLAALDHVLEVALGLKVDTVPRKSLNPRLAPYIDAELVGRRTGRGLTARRFARPLLEDMRAFAADAVQYLGDRTADELLADRMRFLAITRTCELVGEAAAQIPRPIREALGANPFGPAIAMRNRLIHGYGSIDAAIIESTIREDFLPLIAALESALAMALPDESAGGVGGGPDDRDFP